MLPGNPVIWLLALSTALLVVGVLGIVFATRHDRQREQLAGVSSATQWGPGLALVPELRAEINRLRQETDRLRQETDRLRGERDEMLRVMARLAELLEGVGGPRRAPERATRQPQTAASDLFAVESTARR